VSAWAKFIALAIGGALGANARYWLGLVIAQWTGTRFPWPTLIINVSGAFALGFLATAVDRARPDPAMADRMTFVVLVGLLGGYTTFSTFTLESLRMWEQSSVVRSLAYMIASLVVGLLAVASGALLARLCLPSTS